MPMVYWCPIALNDYLRNHVYTVKWEFMLRVHVDK